VLCLVLKPLKSKCFSENFITACIELILVFSGSIKTSTFTCCPTIILSGKSIDTFAASAFEKKEKN
jgi:hypothetical protein